MDPAKRVAMNTGFLYGKMVITIGIALISTRLILNALGAIDFGIFNLVGGVIAMLSFINGAMIIATQRFITFNLGAGDIQKLKAVFSTSVFIHLLIGILIVIILEIAGIFLFQGGLNIPAERINTARTIFQFMVISSFFTINAVPYDASINAHEKMFVDAILGIMESFVKLGIAIWLVYYHSDRLVLYGLLMASLTIFIRIIKGIYCHKNFEECRVRIRQHVQYPLLKEMLTFAGWNLFGLLCSVLRQQGMAILLNIFFGIVINAAYGIANQVNSNISQFSNNMIRAIMPQITKSGGSGNHERMLRLSALACKFSFFLLAVFAVPIIIEMPYILKIWLKIVPENTVIFCRLILVFSMMYQVTVGLMAAITTVGKIRSFQITVGAVEIFNIPLAFVLIKIGLPAYYVFAGSIFLEIISGGLRLWFAHKVAGMPVFEFLSHTYFPSISSAVLAIAIGLGIVFAMHDGPVRLLLVLLCTTVVMSVFSLFIVLTRQESDKLKELVGSFLLKAKHRFVTSR